MWEKNGKPFCGNSVIIGDRKIFNPTDEQMREAGYEWKEPPVPEPLPKRYSRLKIVRKLGEDWPNMRDQIEAAGFMEDFKYAAYLSEDDPEFATFLSNVPEEIKAKLDECLWEDD